MSEPRLDTVRLQRLARSYCEAATLMAAVELGVFTRVARGADTEAALGAALGITAANAERLVTACVALGLLRRDGERLANAPDVARFLVEGEPSYAGPWILFTKPDWDEWGRLASNLRRTDAPVVLGKYASGFGVEEARRYHEATYSIGLGAGRRFVRQVNLSRRRRLVDLGGGSGCYCIAATQAHPDLTAVVFDLPPVVEVAREFIASHGLSHRIATQAGDFTRDPFPAGDVMVMASNLPQYSREIIQQVIDKAFAALAPGGEFHLVGEMLDASRSGPVDPALWGLAEALYGSTGRAHSVTECVGYLERAGFVGVTARDFVPGVLVRVSGSKPA
jgi:hypothetical protein